MGGSTRRIHAVGGVVVVLAPQHLSGGIDLDGGSGEGVGRVGRGGIEGRVGLELLTCLVGHGCHVTSTLSEHCGTKST